MNENLKPTLWRTARALSNTGRLKLMRLVANAKGVKGVVELADEVGLSVEKYEALQLLVADILEYGAAAQVKFNHKADRLATASFKQISVEGGHLSDLCNRGLFLENDTVVITADVPSGKTFAGWKNDAGTIVSTSASYTVTVGGANAKYTAVFN